MSNFQLSLSASIPDIIRFLCAVRELDIETCTLQERNDLNESADIVFHWILPAIAGGMSSHEVMNCALARAEEWTDADYHSDVGFDSWYHANAIAFEVYYYSGIDDTIETNTGSDDDNEMELYLLAAMQHGVQGGNEAKGYFTETPSSCGHHCFMGCDVCG
jgi:hypothetical protein